MNIDDYIRAQREARRLIERSGALADLRLLERSVGLADLRLLEEQVRQALAPPKQYLSEALAFGGVTGDLATKYLATNVLTGWLPLRTQPYLDEIESQRKMYEGFLDVLTFRGAATELFNHLQLDAATQLRQSAIFASVGPTLQNEIMLMREAAFGISSPTASAALATALGGWTNLVENYDEGTLGNAFVNPLTESARYFRQSSEMLAAGPDLINAKAIERSLLLTDIELRATNDALLRIEPFDGEASEAPPPRRLLMPRIQRIELRRMGHLLNEDADINEVLAAIPVGEVVLAAREIVDVFLGIVEAQHSGKTFFKMTQRIARVCAELPFSVPVNRRTFADFIDDLYWLLYESAGASLLRYLTEQGGPLVRENCEVVFVIKRLRNHFRHDPEHGSDREIQKKFAAVHEDLRTRGVERLESGPDYRTIHRVLLKEVGVFLRTLQEAP